MSDTYAAVDASAAPDAAVESQERIDAWPATLTSPSASPGGSIAGEPRADSTTPMRPLWQARIRATADAGFVYAVTYLVVSAEVPR